MNHMRVGLLPSKKICGRSVDHGGPLNQPDSPDMQLDLTSIERCKNPCLPVDACGTGGAGLKDLWYGSAVSYQKYQALFVSKFPQKSKT